MKYEIKKNEYASNQLLLLDDICIGNPLEGESFVFKELIQQCRERNRCGLILVSQLKPAKWLSHMGGTKEAADAALDRVSTNCIHINLEGDSHRSTNNRLTKKEDSHE